jgi:hypothetical protein
MTIRKEIVMKKKVKIAKASVPAYRKGGHGFDSLLAGAVRQLFAEELR